ncbi:Lrp/AsnC family transcriptional regulator [Plebeiibacterium marinum]|uniref:Lrp/AsnC family transcriptional regulator n=1 Tax=Plebeiibacterium marinum TaxID=2992111 RepID=A0AAE3SL34_9BACT|nr:Lrp/AsnC family transcriptional regulator [Plebeiobacterium marinum]MCW3807009.1 Lrp/AsnC family transcriptional regulator [Plebeiobacterium marinum]
MPQLDQTDKDILKLLQQNAKIPHKEIAEKLHLTRTPIFERIRKMERSGIINKYITLLNPKKINRGLTVFCHVSLTRHGKSYVDEFQEKINTFPQAMECYHIAGNYDFFIKVVVKDMEHYQQFVLKELSTIQNISNIQSSFVMGELKHEHCYDLKDL